MKKITVFLFGLIGLVIVIFALLRQMPKKDLKDTVYTKTVIPSLSGGEPSVRQENSLETEETVQTSLIPLLAGEILITAYSIDFDADGYEDQIIALKTPDSQFIKVIVGLYNPFLNKYERSAEIPSDIEQVKTFFLSVSDITGTHENALIITGYGIKNESRFQAWLPRKNASGFFLHEIADLYAAGTIFIQQKNRSDSYPLESADGESFPVWAYTSDPNAPEGSLDQLQIMYDWDKNQKKYVKKVETKITEKSLTAQELSKIQDGTEETFAGFLNGVWMKSGKTAEHNRYLFFDYEKKEIIFFQYDRQELHTWERSTLRRNGILVYTTNQSISNISRRFDIALVSTDEIRIKVVDDLGMLISSETLWDGDYKKQSTDALFAASPVQTQAEKPPVDIIKTLQTSGRTVWKCDNGWELSCSGGVYTAKNGALTESGVFSVLTAFGEHLLQFKSRNTGGVFSGFYRTEIISSQTERSSANAVSDKADDGKKTTGTRIILTPVKLSISQAESALGRSLQLELSAVRD
ncbi:pallilysin-related adhesin [Treponema sp. HNW]|uniref:pallilysin-related adhesin n=1 Tax=Treponema sp. HNW TaxID=3116654 RepID=UPI003D11770A